MNDLRLALLTALLLGAGAAAADEAVATVASVRVEGNERTAADVILRATEIAPGTAYSDVLPELVRQRVYNLRVFDTVSVEPARRGGAIDLTVRVHERWTLLPIPFASAGNDVFRVGMFVVDTN